MWTAQKIIDYVYGLLKEHRYDVSGDIYKNNDLRPFDSEKQDVVINYIAGSVSSREEADIVVNLFTMDILGTDGLYHQDITHTEQAESWLASLEQVLNVEGAPLMFYLTDMVSTDVVQQQDAKFRQHYSTARFKVIALADVNKGINKTNYKVK